MTVDIVPALEHGLADGELDLAERNQISGDTLDADLCSHLVSESSDVLVSGGKSSTRDLLLTHLDGAALGRSVESDRDALDGDRVRRSLEEPPDPFGDSSQFSLTPD